MLRARGIIGIVLLGIGGVWIAQGVDVLEGSFMTGQPVWAWIGAATALVGAALLGWDLRSRSRG